MSASRKSSWLGYWDAPNTSYVSERHKRAHWDVVFAGVRSHLPSRDGVVLDWGCGDALSAERMAELAGTVLLYDAAPSTRKRLRELHGTHPGIRILDEAELFRVTPGSIDLVVVNSVIQYLGKQDLAAALRLFAHLLKPGGTVLVGDVITPGTPTLRHVTTFLAFAFRHGFLSAALAGLARTSISPYRRLRRELGLAAYAPDEMIALLARNGLAAVKLPANIAVSCHRASYLARKLGITESAPKQNRPSPGIGGAA
jgi:ubiquinone/menaquinone biosynthesis C-methylase UbiE